MPVGIGIHEVQERRRVDEVAILPTKHNQNSGHQDGQRTYMSEYDTVRGVDIERLRLCMMRTACSRVPHYRTPWKKASEHSSNEPIDTITSLTMSDAHAAPQPRHGVHIENISDHPVGFALVESALGPAGDDPARILPAVLQ